MSLRQPKTDGYLVRDILDYKQENGQEYLLIWWRSYARRNATWQPKENIQHLHDFQQYYQKLKQAYYEKMKENDNVEKKEQPVQKKSKAKGKGKAKKIEKEVKKTKCVSDEKHSGSEGNHSPQEEHKQVPLMAQQINTDNNIAFNNSLEGPPTPYDNDNSNVNLARTMTKDELKRLIRNAPPVQFQIKIKQFKDLPLAGKKLRRIKQPFIQEGNVMYQIEIENMAATQQPLIIHEDFLKVMWPHMFAEYLLSKKK